MFQRILRILDLIIYVLLGILLLTASNPVSSEPAGRARAYTRPIEFDYFSWSVDAALLKLQSSSTGLPSYLSYETQEDSLHLLAFHAIPQTRTLAKTQSIFERNE